MIYIFGGTTEGRRLVEVFERNKIPAKYFVATEYGEDILGKTEWVQVEQGRKNKDEMMEMLSREEVEMVLDATHPFATVVSQNIKESCKICDVKYLRIRRESQKPDRTHRQADNETGEGVGQKKEKILYFQEIAKIVEYLNARPGNILLTTGSKQIRAFDALERERLYARVLPDLDSIHACVEAGIKKGQILAMQGPFSKELNASLLRNYRCDYLVTKESGSVGGFLEKIEGAMLADATVLVLGRPSVEEGMTVEEFLNVRHLEESSNTADIKISILGIGPGDAKFLTKIGEEIIRQADAICGASRMIAFAKLINPDIVADTEYMPNKIVQWILERIEAKHRNIVVLMSGDSGFYSGTKKLFCQLQEMGLHADIYPGISSVSLLASRLGIPWDGYHILSLHGKDKGDGVFSYPELMQSVGEQEYTFVITDGLEKNEGIIKMLVDTGFLDVTVYIGEELGLSKERITKDFAKNLLHHRFSKLCVLLIHNPNAKSYRYAIGIQDDVFLRGNVPMTKEEIRILSLAKLNIQPHEICFDIGAGTGSVSIEMSRLARATYAIEQKEHAIALIRENALKFQIPHTIMDSSLTKYRLNIIHKKALEALEDLPKPDCVFIGGSGGELKGIIQKCRAMNPKVRIVVNAISMETIAQLYEMLRMYEKEGQEVEIVTVNIAKSKTVGAYHMMNALNPVMIVSFGCNEKKM